MCGCVVVYVCKCVFVFSWIVDLNEFMYVSILFVFVFCECISQVSKVM